MVCRHALPPPTPAPQLAFNVCLKEATVQTYSILHLTGSKRDPIWVYDSSDPLNMNPISYYITQPITFFDR